MLAINISFFFLKSSENTSHSSAYYSLFLSSLLLTTSFLTPYYFSPYSLLHKEKAPASLVKTGRQGLFLRVLMGIRAAEWPEKGGLRRGV